MIDSTLPATWADLQTAVAGILTEAGLEAKVEHDLTTARGSVNVDVWAVDTHVSPPATMVCECKRWATAVPKNVVHGFRAVVADIGANAGLVISSSGFQKGAYEAAAFSNVRLVTWAEFQSIFEDRWYQRYFVPKAKVAADQLIDYTEPINSRIFAKADALSAGKRTEFRDLREKYFSLVCVLWPVLFPTPGITDVPTRPALPLRTSLEQALGIDVPIADIVLDAPDLRRLLDAIIKECVTATAAFDALFGERA
jgi:restriction system protein